MRKIWTVDHPDDGPITCPNLSFLRTAKNIPIGNQEPIPGRVPVLSKQKTSAKEREGFTSMYAQSSPARHQGCWQRRTAFISHLQRMNFPQPFPIGLSEL